MSIYGSRKIWNGFGVVAHRAPGAVADPSNAGASRGHGIDWSSARRAQPADFILPVSQNWLDALPPAVLPAALATHYPRIVNVIAARWHNRSECPPLFEDLLVDRRGGRAGFPPPVRRDLLNLREYWYNGRPRP